ncbi:hypothetical protein C5167_036833 [Papaver somniferum]|uniref:NAC domain-containing protein n=1 Tax=Papaver somniferum TaxID=3469 RepID=A0A4Y7I4R3_PAPSO|nr:NAC domain-containing protein 72-like [Papaver somniferum]RZC43893.1 hypothetical protein C5167_036833 [Papaver somniferum]
MMAISDNLNPVSQLSLPPGFRFYPTDEELLVQYLCRKVAGYNFKLNIIGEIDLYKFDPWVLPSKAIFGEKEWYFFSPRDRKYPNGSRPNRVAGSGYWKATGTDKIITTEGRKVGIKKALVFYIGKAPKGTKTNWIMHEYRLLENSKKHGSSRLDDWVLCRIYKKNSSAQKAVSSSSEVNSITSSKEQSSNGTSSSSSSSQFDDVLDSLPEINDQFFSLPRMNSLKNFQDQENNNKLMMMNFQNLDTSKFDWSSLAAMASLPELNNNNSNPTIGRSTTNNQAYPDSTNYHLQQRSSIEEEVESRNGSQQQQRVNSGNYFQQNSNDFLQNYNSESFDSFGHRYLTQHPVSGGSFGYKV